MIGELTKRLGGFDLAPEVQNVLKRDAFLNLAVADLE